MNDCILITGGSGLLAVNWAISVRGRYSVTLGVNKRDISLTGVNRRAINLETTDTFIGVLKEIRPKIVVHTAGLTSIEMCEANPALAYHVNVDLTKNAAQACFTLGIKFIHISTDHLFSGNQPLSTEEQSTSPLNVYAQTKAEAELIALQENPQSLVIRTNFYGWGPSHRKSFSDTVINALRANQRIHLFQDVHYTPILAEVLIQVIHQLIDKGANGVFNIVSNDRVSKYDFGLRLAKEFNLNTDLIVADQIANRPLLVRRPYDMSLSNQKLINFLGGVVGGLDQHLVRLRQQEINGLAQELQKL